MRILGITTQYGISSAPNAFYQAREVIGVVHRFHRRVPANIPVLRGAADANSLGTPTPASRFLDAEVLRHCGQVEIIDTAPPTNTATAMMRAPRFARCLKRLWLTTGEFDGTLPHVPRSDLSGGADFNINADAPAAGYILTHARHLVILPNELEDDTWMTKHDYASLAPGASKGDPCPKDAASAPNPPMPDSPVPLTGIPSTLGCYVAEQNLPYYRYYFTAPYDNPANRTPGLPNEPGIMFHGAIATAVALDPSFRQDMTTFLSGVTERYISPKQLNAFRLVPAPPKRRVLILARLSSRQARRVHNAIMAALH